MTSSRTTQRAAAEAAVIATSARETQCKVADREVRPVRLTDQQLVALSNSARRADHVIAIGDRLRGAALDAFGRRLLGLGLAAERLAQPGQPVWRRDEVAGGDLTLVITDAGLAALGIETAGEAAVSAASDPHVPALDRISQRPDVTSAPIEASQASRPLSKQARLIGMLSREGGCSTGEAAAALGWLPHTTRAALTGLRHKGYVIERAKGEAGAATRHRIVGTPKRADDDANGLVVRDGEPRGGGPRRPSAKSTLVQATAEAGRSPATTAPAAVVAVGRALA